MFSLPPIFLLKLTGLAQCVPKSLRFSSIIFEQILRIFKTTRVRTYALKRWILYNRFIKHPASCNSIMCICCVYLHMQNMPLGVRDNIAFTPLTFFPHQSLDSQLCPLFSYFVNQLDCSFDWHFAHCLFGFSQQDLSSFLPNSFLPCSHIKTVNAFPWWIFLRQKARLTAGFYEIKCRISKLSLAMFTLFTIIPGIKIRFY